jgi:hypothetical protein
VPTKKKQTQKNRIARLMRMGLTVAQMIECTGMHKSTVKSYVWRVNNPERTKKFYKDYYINNREARLKYNRKYYKDNKEEIKIKNAEYWLTYERKPKHRSVNV